MRVAVPSDTDQGLESTRSGHFGHSPYFTIATIEDGKVEKVEVFKNVDHDKYGCGGVLCGRDGGVLLWFRDDVNFCGWDDVNFRFRDDVNFWGRGGVNF